MDALARFATALFASLAEAAPYLVIGYLVVALLREFVPAATLSRYLGGRGAAPLFRALGIGTLLPVCSCGSIPVGIGLFRSGASVGTVLALMTSSPAISPVSFVLGYTLLGPELLAALVGTVLVGSFLLGLAGNRLFEGSGFRVQGPGVSNQGTFRQLNPEPRILNPGWFRRAVRWAFWDLGADVSLDLLIGLSVAAAILAFVPTEWTTAWLGHSSLWAMLAVILISIPMYTCSVPAMLVMNSLLVSGATPGAAVAFLIAGPASNLGELNAIRGAMGNRAAAFYSAALVVVALVGGMVTDQVVFRHETYAPPAVEVTGTEQVARSIAQGAGDGERSQTAGSLLPASSLRHVPAWHYPFVVVLVAVMALGIARRVGRRNAPHCDDDSQPRCP
jgi:uncharacterized membrane protein YraQ (UPF0718 family)